MEPDLAPLGSAIRKNISKTIRFGIDQIRHRKDSEKSDVSAFYSQMPIYFFQKHGINKL